MFEKRIHHRHKIPDEATTLTTSWLDIYPSSPSVAESTSNPVPEAKHFARMNALKQTLESDIKPVIKIREYFLWIYTTGRKVCFYCSNPEAYNTSCGPSCTHLWPLKELSVREWIKQPWRDNASATITNYYRILGEMEIKGSKIRSSQLFKWEKEVEDLRKGALSWSEVREEGGWTKVADYSKTKADVNWIFERAWGIRFPLEEDVAPDEGISTDRVFEVLDA